MNFIKKSFVLFRVGFGFSFHHSQNSDPYYFKNEIDLQACPAL